MHAHTHTHAHTQTHIHKHNHTYTFTHKTHTCTHTHTHTIKHTYMYTYTHTHTHTQTNTHTYIHKDVTAFLLEQCAVDLLLGVASRSTFPRLTVSHCNCMHAGSGIQLVLFPGFPLRTRGAHIKPHSSSGESQGTRLAFSTTDNLMLLTYQPLLQTIYKVIFATGLIQDCYSFLSI